MQKAGEMAYVFLFGCFLYSLIEIAARGYTHWSMTLTGGICLAYIYHITADSHMNLIKKCFAGAVFITCSEFAVGVAVNVVMKWDVWDYSDMPANLYGQICLPFSALWFLLCFAGCGISAVISDKFKKLYTYCRKNDEIRNSIFQGQES